MFEIKDFTGKVLETPDTVKYIRWGKNGVPRLCSQTEAEGIVLNDMLYKLVERPELEEYERVTVENISIDSFVLEMEKRTREGMLASMEAQAELGEMLDATMENQYAIMEAIADMFEMNN